MWETFSHDFSDEGEKAFSFHNCLPVLKVGLFRPLMRWLPALSQLQPLSCMSSVISACNFLRLLMWTKGQWFSRTLLGLQHLIGIAETSTIMN